MTSVQAIRRRPGPKIKNPTVLKTETVGTDENPRWTICKGHVDAKIFNQAFEAEGWSSDSVHEDDLSHEWWKLDAKGFWTSTTKDDAEGTPVTVMEW